jgi:hypothetical protein
MGPVAVDVEGRYVEASFMACILREASADATGWDSARAEQGQRDHGHDDHDYNPDLCSNTDADTTHSTQRSISRGGRVVVQEFPGRAAARLPATQNEAEDMRQSRGGQGDD